MIVERTFVFLFVQSESVVLVEERKVAEPSTASSPVYPDYTNRKSRLQQSDLGVK
jgi:hypothetical protein